VGALPPSELRPVLEFFTVGAEGQTTPAPSDDWTVKIGNSGDDCEGVL
jgi:hypothetical protein